MSRFLSDFHSALEAYTPGEQPQDRSYIKLNTNESPFPPSPGVAEAVRQEAEALRLYSDPESRGLREKVAELYQLEPEQVLMVNGSDEILNFAFLAFCTGGKGAVFPDITYGFYKVFADLYHIPYREIPLKEDFSLDYRDYLPGNAPIFIANPNAPTGRVISPEEIEAILLANPNRVVVIDEAYGDFAHVSAIPLISKYHNLLVTRTFSKSYSMAGARLGMGLGSPALIRDLSTMKYSTNPYNVNRLTTAAGLAALEENAYYMDHCREICTARDTTRKALKAMGFEVLPSQANFLFARIAGQEGQTLYEKLKVRGILVRHFNSPRIRDFIRITVGTQNQMEALLHALSEILKE